MDRPQRQPPPSRGGAAAKPSFSSTLLDAIYRSIDNDDGHTVRAQHTSPLHSLTKKHASTGTTVTLPAETRKPSKPALRHKHRHRVYSSPDCSEPVQHGLRPIRTRAMHEKQESKTVDKRLEDLRTPKTPASPGARLSRFLNSLFSKKEPEPVSCSTARACLNKTTSLRKGIQTCETTSSYARSCMNKTMSMNAGDRKKIVRFEPVSNVVACPERKGRVEEWESDSSSDLFELEELKRGIRDELPVYKSTNVGRLRRGL